MILVDTSVLIDYLKGKENEKSVLFQKILDYKLVYGISSIVFLEVLQGTKTEEEYRIVKEYLESLRFYELKNNRDSYEKAARMSFLCSRAGVTVRSTIDLIISRIAIENELMLLHNDSDFDAIASVIPELHVCTVLDFG